MKKGKKSLCLALAAALVILCLAQGSHLGVTYGALGIETDKECSITFHLDVNYEKPENAGDSDEYTAVAQPFDELSTSKIPVKLYKIADVNISGHYVEPQQGPTDSAVNTVLYEALKDRLTAVNAETKASEWLSMAETAMQKVGEQEEAATPLPVVAETTINEPASGDGLRIEGLSTGLYLVAADDVWTSEYIYHFTPYLVSLPGNAYSGADTSDEWLYDVTVGLKASRENRYGDLEIVKTLHSYNATLGGATFVFQVESETKDGIQYSDVVSIVFDQAGTKSVKLAEKIPAGAKVTVTEVYSGASYEVITAPEQTGTIVARDPQNPDDPENLTIVRFENDYDDRINGGTSVVNHFAYSEPQPRPGDSPETDASLEGASGESRAEGVWSFEQLRDSTEEGRVGNHE